MTVARTTSTSDISTVPIPQDILEEIEIFEEEVARVQTGETSTDIFKPFRLQYGIYGQRQPEVQMIRIKIPFGGLTSNQLRRVAELTDTYATGVGHITTRQDIQLHFVPLQQVGTVMRKLAEVDVTTREACANTVRNVTACHLAGVCQGEVFDVTTYAKTVAQHLLRNPLTQSLPRKFKIAFSGCRHDCALTPIHDVGLLAAKREDGTIGFRMVVGGGLGSTPRLAHLLNEFVPMEDLLPSIEAVIKVFDKLGNRKNRTKARLKFVIDKLGFEEFKRRWTKIYLTTKQSSDPTVPLKVLTYSDEPPLIMPNPGNNGSRRNSGKQQNGQLDTPSPFQIWRASNVIKQKQDGFVSAMIKLPTGDITTEQMFAIADLADTYSNQNIRTTIDQNLIIRWIPESNLEMVYQALCTHRLGDPGVGQFEDIVACPGTDTCGLGITSSKGLARKLAELFPPGETSDDLKGANMKISGCHNSCAQHHIATIGLHGVGKRIGEHIAPVYEVHLGGQVNGTASIGQLTVKIPAKNIPAALKDLVALYRQNRTTGESLQTYITRMGKAQLKDYLIPHTLLPTFSEDPTYYYDWEADEEFSMEDLGPGECAGGALEMIDNRILEAEQELYQARVLADKHQYGFAINKAYRAVVAGAKALLVTEGIDPNTDAETLAEFDQLTAQRHGVIPATYNNVSEQASDLGSKVASQEFVQDKLSFARGFVEACRVATEQIGEDLKLGVQKEGQEQTSSPDRSSAIPAAADTPPVYDLRGVMCPMNYVKTKLKMEMMDHGDQLEVWLDAGDPIKNVPMSLRNDGHKVLSEDPLEADAQHYKILVEKVEA
ncbi:MAG: HEPN domain-containing protein [Nitrospirales bacterium]|nr:HEPN domain-containing protein [Nitrospirales bacterium]